MWSPKQRILGLLLDRIMEVCAPAGQAVLLPFLDEGKRLHLPFQDSGPDEEETQMYPGGKEVLFLRSSVEGSRSSCQNCGSRSPKPGSGGRYRACGTKCQT